MKKKLLSLCLVLALALTAIGGTLAYFTDTTEAVKNEFTVGNVDIDLSEDNWPGGTGNLMPGVNIPKDPTITVLEGSQDCYVFLKMDLNKYVSLINLMGVDAYKNGIGNLSGPYPGFTAFMGALAENNGLRETVVDRWFQGIKHDNWKIMNLDEIEKAVSGADDATNPKTLSVILGYIGSEDDTLSAGEKVTFMSHFGMPATVTASMFDGEDAYYIGTDSKSDFNTDKANFKMTFTAYAIQAVEIAGIDAAYGALFPTTGA